MLPELIPLEGCGSVKIEVLTVDTDGSTGSHAPGAVADSILTTGSSHTLGIHHTRRPGEDLIEAFPFELHLVGTTARGTDPSAVYDEPDGALLGTSGTGIHLRGESCGGVGRLTIPEGQRQRFLSQIIPGWVA